MSDIISILTAINALLTSIWVIVVIIILIWGFKSLIRQIGKSSKEIIKNFPIWLEKYHKNQMEEITTKRAIEGRPR